MEIESLFGLPAHPLLVHAAVVLLPLAAIGNLVVAAVPSTRRHHAVLALSASLAALVAIVLAQGSGEELEEQVRETALVEAHTGQGESVLPWAIGVAVTGLAVVAIPRRTGRAPGGRPGVVTGGLVALALVTGAGAVWTIAEVGHSGARATWSPTLDDAGDDGQGGDRDDG